MSFNLCLQVTNSSSDIYMQYVNPLKFFGFDNCVELNMPNAPFSSLKHKNTDVSSWSRYEVPSIDLVVSLDI